MNKTSQSLVPEQGRAARMNLKLSLVTCLYLLSRAGHSEDCDDVSLTAGGTWLDMVWSPYCGINNPHIVSHYTIIITDTTFFIYNQTMITYCNMMNCSTHIPGLHPCITYQVDLEVSLYNGSSYKYQPSTQRTTEVKPGRPRDMKVESSTLTNLRISWLPPIDSICTHSYIVCTHSLHTNTPTVQCSSTKSLSITIPSLTPCSQYMVEVIPVTVEGMRGMKAVLTTSTQMEQPDKAEITGYECGYDYIQLLWNMPHDSQVCVTGTGAECRVSSSQDPGMCARSGGEGSLDTTVVGLRECRVYDCRIQLLSGDRVTYSDIISACTWVRGVTISSPTRLSTWPGVTDITLLWSPPVQGDSCVDQYSVQCGPYHTIIPGNSTEYRVDNLEPCTPYTLAITPLSLHWGTPHNGTTAQIAGETLSTTPGQVGNLRQVSSTTTGVTIQWATPEYGGQCVTSYRVRVEGGGEGHHYDTREVEIIDCLECGTEYNVTVWAVGRDGGVGEGVMIQVDTEDCPA